MRSPTTHGGNDAEPKTATGEMQFEAAIIVAGTIRVDVEAGAEEQMICDAKDKAIRVLRSAWCDLDAPFAAALRDQLTEKVDSLAVYSILGEDEPVPLVVMRSEDGGSI